MTQHQHRSELRLRRIPPGHVYLIYYREAYQPKLRIIGRCDALPIMTKKGLIDPPILMHERVTEQLLGRIKDMLNERDGTNRDFVVRWPPNKKKIAEYRRKRIRW